ncbi:MAG: type I polyketide synthase, partial [Myxococcales bacterium]|nr:type I polyketide synthase [Myxococcales bacterium]
RCVIRSCAVNNDGASNGLTAPNPVAQHAVLRRAYQRAGVAPARVHYVEAHGTGTPLGDPVELQGLRLAFDSLYRARGLTPPARPHCGLGSIKSNIGHAETAAGVAGLIKVVLGLRERALYRSLHADQPSELLELDGSPFYLLDRSRAWPAPRVDGELAPRRAAVSSFGAGGANAHVVVEEYVAPDGWRDGPRARAVPRPGTPRAIVLSAKREAALARVAEDLLAQLDRRAPPLRDLAASLQLAREAWAHRAAFLAADLDELRELLTRLVASEADARIVRGDARAGRETLDALYADDQVREAMLGLVERGKPAALLELWVRGLAVDWRRLGAGERARVELPPYPLAQAHYWVGARPAAQVSAAPRPTPTEDPALGHPLLQARLSDAPPRYGLTLTGREPFLRDHVVAGRMTLPGTVSIELARAAIEHATQGAVHISLEDHRWLRPVIVEATPVQLRTTLRPISPARMDYTVELERPGGEAIVHARGHALLTAGPAPASVLDLPALARATTASARGRGASHSTMSMWWFKASATDSSATTRPCERMTTRSQSASTSARMCDEKISVWAPPSPRSIARISCTWLGSRPTVGSSRTTSGGAPSSASAMPTRCR